MCKSVPSILIETHIGSNALFCSQKQVIYSQYAYMYHTFNQTGDDNIRLLKSNLPLTSMVLCIFYLQFCIRQTSDNIVIAAKNS